MYLLHHLLDPRPDDATQVAVVEGENEASFAALRSAAVAYAARLRGGGIQRGDRIGILLPKGREECAAIFGVSYADGVFVPINPLLKPAQIRHILADCGARVLITAQAMLEGLADHLAGLDLQTLVVPSQDVGSNEHARAAPSASIGEDLAAILYTSGSTGNPKGVMLSHRNLLAGARIVAKYLELKSSDRILSLLPFSFDYGLNQLLTAVQVRAAIVLQSFRLGNDIVDALSRHRITGLAGVPTIWTILARTAPKLATTPLPHLRYVTNSGGALPTDTVRRLRERLPQARIYLMYGLTEAFRSTYLPPDEIDRRPTSIGKAIPECEVFAVSPDGRRTRPGEPGILVHRGPTVSLGYWRNPTETAKVLRQNPLRPAEEGIETVCYSGDLVVEDEDGFFTFVGRSDAMIKSSGYRISPSEVEDALMATRAFRQIAVIGLPDDLLGQRVHAVAVPGPEPVDVAAILRGAARQLAPYMVPRMIELVPDLPTTPNGKVDYKRLVHDRGTGVDG
ncbi:AMP-binding protein [Methylobacterium iners]|uniref:Long-chain-fatty-acid--CoA ligase n=1 Tax=Methylobacterium iners TaxID=418707 RepID=A0ABQ4RWC1_9HYPH|nr:AMP-binding protein [Methylobacterium iners]GJD93963.1 Long-chain-fatty-acid--CoA ligase [Methylobacterium iners]